MVVASWLPKMAMTEPGSSGVAQDAALTTPVTAICPNKAGASRAIAGRRVLSAHAGEASTLGAFVGGSQRREVMRLVSVSICGIINSILKLRRKAVIAPVVQDDFVLR